MNSGVSPGAISTVVCRAIELIFSNKESLAKAGLANKQLSRTPPRKIKTLEGEHKRLRSRMKITLLFIVIGLQSLVIRCSA